MKSTDCEDKERIGDIICSLSLLCGNYGINGKELKWTEKQLYRQYGPNHASNELRRRSLSRSLAISAHVNLGVLASAARSACVTQFCQLASRTTSYETPAGNMAERARGVFALVLVVFRGKTHYKSALFAA